MWCVVQVQLLLTIFFFQAEGGIRGLVRSRGLGDVYEGQSLYGPNFPVAPRQLAGDGQ